MTEQTKLVPKRRFKEFQDTPAWEERKLGELCDEFHSGKNIKSEDIRDEGRYPVFGGNGLRGYTNTYNHDGLYALIGRQGALCGNMNISNGKAYFTEHAVAVKGNKSNETRFLFYLLGQMNLGQYSGQSAQPGLAVNKLKELSAFIPTFAEQAQISALFKKLDNLITLQQRKLEKTKALKSAYLSEMFPAEGEREPIRRFAGFTQAWEEEKLAELTDVYDGTHQTPDYKNEGIMFLSVENIKTLKSKKYISKEAFENEFKIRPEKGDVLMTRIGDIGTASVVESDEPIAYYVSLALLKKKKLNPYFLQASIHSPAMQNEIYKRTLHIAFPKKINKNELADVPIRFPSDAEQIKIGEFFKNIDHLITLHQRKLEKLQSIKKAYLNEMFV